MAKLFAIQHCSSLCRTLLFTVFLELIVVNKCSSSQEICNTRNISYFKLGNEELTWFQAWKQCFDLNSNLPVICNQNDQDALINYLRPDIARTAIWTSGKKITDWTWVDGQPFINGGMLSSQHESYTHVALDGEINYKAQDPLHVSYYLCQYSGSSCNSEYDISVTKGCVRPSDDDRSWYDARNQCLTKGGDLAILTYADFGILRRNKILLVRSSYWIGLRKNMWHWIRQGTVNRGEEIRYTSWSHNTPSSGGECISIDPSNGKWKADGCTDRLMAVCERISDATTSSTSSSTTIASEISRFTITSAMPSGRIASAISSTKMASAASSTTTGTNASLSESASESVINSNVENDPQVLLKSGVGAGIVFIAICIIVVILTVRYKRKSPKEIDHSKGNRSSEQHRFDEFANKPDNSPASASENAPLAGADDTRGVYAEISLATLNQLESRAKTEQPGIVYAALEFHKEPISLEREKKSARTTDPTKQGTANRSYQDFETTGRQANPDGAYTGLQLQPVYEEVSQREN